MHCLMTTKNRRDCERCSAAIPAGLVAFTDELAPQFKALCADCLAETHPELALYQRLATKGEFEARRAWWGHARPDTRGWFARIWARS